jgi:Fe-Mn family superoxide dismutase
MSFELPKLNYAYDALEPYIDAKTMEIHHSKHHAGYTSKLNAAIKDTELENKSIEEILINLDMKNSAVRNSGGGFYNHNLFWEIMSPNDKGNLSRLPSALKAEIEKSFGTFEAFVETFTKAASTQFGSGWAWLCCQKDGKLSVCATANQDNPLMPGIGCGGTPILGLDVWEHAYYLKYQNMRGSYIESFFNVVNWHEVYKKYEALK